MTRFRDKFNKDSYANLAISGLLVLTSFLVLGVVLHYSGHGLDLTDESFYLQWVAEPWRYQNLMPLTFFGYVLHPLYWLAKGDVTVLRQMNVIITFVLAGLLSFLLLKQVDKITGNSQSIPLYERLALATALASGGLISFSYWLLSPNYNSLAFQSLLLVGISSLLIHSASKRSLRIGWVVLGVGGWLLFMAKPSSAALLAVIFPLTLFASGYNNWRYLSIGVVTSVILVLTSVLIIDGSLSLFVARVLNSLEAAQVLGSGQELSKIFRIDSFDLKDRDYMIFSCIVLTTVLLIFAKARLNLRCITVMMAAAYVLLSCAAVWMLFNAYPQTTFRGNMLALFPVAAFCTSLLLYWRKKIPHLWNRQAIVTAIFLFITPYIYAFGTNGNYWQQGSAAGLFWMLSTIVIVMPIFAAFDKTALVRLVAFSCLLLVGIVAGHAMAAPYRQPVAVWDQKTTLDLRDFKIRLSKGFVDYFETALKTASDAGYQRGMPVIDLSGKSPGILFAMDAKNLGQPWMVGGYPGSNEFAILNLEKESCADIARAFILVEPDGRRSQNASFVMAALGQDLDDFYTPTPSFDTAQGAAGYEENYRQFFLKPIESADVMEQSCLQARTQKQTTR